MRASVRLVTLLLGCTVLAGCAGKIPAAVPTATPGHHEHHASHGGTLYELGEEEFAHMELVPDPKEGRLVAFFLDGEAENSMRLQSREMKGTLILPSGENVPMLFKAKASTLTGETIGDSSQFEVETPKLRNCESFELRVPELTIRGQVFKALSFRYPETPEIGK
jgi:hypothetical protein